MITKMADKMAAACQFAFVDTHLTFITRFLPNLIYELLSSNSRTCLNGVMFDEQ